MLQSLPIENILFLDIETVPAVYRYEDLDHASQTLWANKTQYIQERNEQTAAEVYEKAGIYAEFGKIICISTGFVHAVEGGRYGFRVKSFYGQDERQLLTDFANMLQHRFSDPKYLLCGHNAKEFDFPYISRRMLINGIALPDMLNLAGKKPWEVKHLDTMELWKFGDYKHYTALNLLAHIFHIPTPKDDISGADVARVYYEESDLERIRIYCEKDTLTVAQVMLRFMGKPIIELENVIAV